MLDVKKGIAIHEKNLVSENVAGKTYYFFANTAMPMKEDIYLLPNYDEYTIAYKERELFFDPEEAKKLPPVGRAVAFSHTIVKEGKIIGMYRREIVKEKVVITPKFFDTPTADEKEALRNAAEKYGMFLGIKVFLK